MSEKSIRSDNIIAVDLDGVIFDFTTTFTALLSKELNRNITKFDIKNYQYYENEDVCTKEEYNRMFKQFIDENGFVTLDFIDGAKEGIKSLYDAGYKIIFVTDRPYASKEITFQRLSEIGIDFKLIYAQGCPKYQIAVDHKCDVLIDNYLNILRYCKKETQIFPLYFNDQGHLADFDYGIVEVRDWEKCVEVIKSRRDDAE